MSEINGLKATILASLGTIHGIQGPPEREDFGSDEAYASAHHAWYVRMNYWTVERVDA